MIPSVLPPPPIAADPVPAGGVGGDAVRPSQPLSPQLSRHLSQFNFPLNAYAAMLQWSEGRVDCLHFGLFDNLDEPIWQAQERASQRLWAQMPPPCSVLEVGIGLGHTLARLGQRGYTAVGITPDAAQVAYAQTVQGTDLSVEVTTLENFAPSEKRFDLMLLQESAQYIQPLALLEAADRLLHTEKATLLLMDEFALTRANDADFGLHLLPHFKALAERFGWRLAHEEDVTIGARVTMDVIERLTQRYAARLRQDLGVSDADLVGLEVSTTRYAHNYKTGVYGYRVLRFERHAVPVLRPVLMDGHSAATAPETLAMRALFQRVFGREMTAPEWQWKYGQGRGCGVALAARDGSFGAFYGGLTRPLRLFGQPALGCQVCDVMIEPGVRVSLRRQGPSYQVTASFLEAQIGWARPHAVGFGFPTDRALSVAERLGLYERVDELVQLLWPALSVADGVVEVAATAGVALDLRALKEGLPHWADLQAAWAVMAADLRGSVLGVRDPAWLHYRYGLKPDASYEALLLQAVQPGGAFGVVIFRRHASHFEVLDWVAPLAHIPALIAALRRKAAISPNPLPVLAWITASHTHHLRQPDDDAVLEPLNLFVPANAHTPGVSPEDLRGRWFLTAGDTDFR